MRQAGDNDLPGTRGSLCLTVDMMGCAGKGGASSSPANMMLEGFQKHRLMVLCLRWLPFDFEQTSIRHEAGSHPADPQASQSQDETETGGHGLTSAAGSAAPGAVGGAGWDSVENQEDMAVLALVSAPPTD